MVKMLRELNIPRVMFFNPGAPMKTSMPITSMRRKEKATGNPARSRMISPPRKKVNTIHHSILMPASVRFSLFRFSTGGAGRPGISELAQSR